MGVERRAGSPARLDTKALEEAALSYLNRFDASVSKLRSVLQRKIARHADDESVDVAALRASMEELLTRYQASGLLDDHRLAANAAERLSARGASRRAILHKLTGHGIAADLAQSVLSTLEIENPDREYQAAVAYVRRRRLGPHRPTAARAPSKHKDLAALARAGFGLDVARRALSQDDLSQDDWDDA